MTDERQERAEPERGQDQARRRPPGLTHPFLMVWSRDQFPDLRVPGEKAVSSAGRNALAIATSPTWSPLPALRLVSASSFGPGSLGGEGRRPVPLVADSGSALSRCWRWLQPPSPRPSMRAAQAKSPAGRTSTIRPARPPDVEVSSRSPTSVPLLQV